MASRDSYGQSIETITLYWDEEFIGRDLQFQSLATSLRSKFEDVWNVIDDVGDDLLKSVTNDIPRFINYTCSSDRRDPESCPDYARLVVVAESTKHWYPVIEQLIKKQQLETLASSVQAAVFNEDKYESLNKFIIKNNFKLQKFRIPFSSASQFIKITLYDSLNENAIHYFYIHSCSVEKYFTLSYIFTDDYEVSISYGEGISWPKALGQLLIWLNTVADLVSLKVSSTLSLISKGESKTLEFKSTLCYDLKEKGRKSHIEHAVLKTIAAFLNSEGGTLLIGVTDDGTIHGLENDFKVLTKKGDSRDEFNKHFDDLIGKNFGRHVHRLIHLELESIDSKLIAKVVVPRKAPEPVFLKNKEKNNTDELYIRLNASSVSLGLPEATKYIKDHWMPDRI